MDKDLEEYREIKGIRFPSLCESCRHWFDKITIDPKNLYGMRSPYCEKVKVPQRRYSCEMYSKKK